MVVFLNLSEVFITEQARKVKFEEKQNDQSYLFIMIIGILIMENTLARPLIPWAMLAPAAELRLALLQGLRTFLASFIFQKGTTLRSRSMV